MELRIDPVTKTSRDIRRCVDRLRKSGEYRDSEFLQTAVHHLLAAHDQLPKDRIEKEFG